MNKGLTGREIAEIVRLPPHLANHPYLIGKRTKNVFFRLWTNHCKSNNKSFTVPKKICFVINFFILEYYGTVEWSVKAVYHGYMGWFSARYRTVFSKEKCHC
jgi:alkyl sulfatase BDS1-like metallo-beta-lactamase superfamily hydrolase